MLFNNLTDLKSDAFVKTWRNLTACNEFIGEKLC
ncbi:hypothetical protein HD_1537 [[Haemophilus] ducreyi 35000HP]|uniref:Uncharacterized protein n=1 Tax=Haemophilus ducreyi (strain 35000HP / ATCC 700724) TaxID=233412 RepID=Q7VLC5_HAEDU|nr:hypothetical protein HD_1537 [[Haemophilus] ducreyi 35000HP]